MTSIRKPPYFHSDGSNCWTRNCSRRGKEISAKKAFFTETPKPANNLPPLSAFQKAKADGRIESSHHPVHPYVTFKYSRETQFASDWDAVTLAARGIIFNEKTGEVVARPFAKFFNHNEPSVPRELLHGKVSVTDKLDGSLAIGYVDEDGKFNIATAGSFKSDQAKHATALYHERYEGKWSPNPKLTYMWEIIYPENRVVVDYGEENDIHLIGAVNKRTGRSVPTSELTEWKGKKAEEYKDFSSLDAVLAAPDRHNKEGFIVHYVDTDTRVKYKHGEYLTLHRYATGVTSKTIWRKMRAAEDMTSWKQNMPEEFADFISERQNGIQAAFNGEVAAIGRTHLSFAAGMPTGYDRKAFAQALKASSTVKPEDKPFVMNLEFTGKIASNDVGTRKVWERVKPEDEVTLWNM